MHIHRLNLKGNNWGHKRRFNLRSLWEVYLSENKYIGDLTFDTVVDVVTIISNRVSEM